MTTDHHNTDRPDHVTQRFDTSRQLTTWLSGELAHKATLSLDQHDESSAEVAVIRRNDRVAEQLARVCELVGLALAQVDDNNDLGLAWILLEQARQQLGHAATVDRTKSQPGGDDVDAETSAMSHLVWFLQRDLMPWPDDASVIVDFGNGTELPPDLRPETPLELVPLQLLAHSAMTLNAGDDALDIDNNVMAMAFGEYVSTIMHEAMALLEFITEQADEKNMAALTDTGFEVADLVAGAFPPAWQAFQGPAGIPRDRDNPSGAS